MKINKRMAEIIRLGESLGLDGFPIVFEEVSAETMANIASYGLPTRARHWSYGRSYDHQKTYGEMGLSKIYELIINNNPAYAFMLDTNTEIQNLFITAHCVGHSFVFKHNFLFQDTNRNMIRHSADHAGRIEDYIEKYGFEAVERLMDIGFALDKHIDWNRGQFRKPYPKREVRYRELHRGEFDDLLVKNNHKKASMIREVRNDKFPPQPEKDLLWFFINYAPLEDWERDVLDIIREEAFYFYPQMHSKILNEGLAVWAHAEIMFQYTGITPDEHLDFCRDHEKVVQSGGNPFRINPYFLGFRIFKDIEERWDYMYKRGKADINGKQKILQVAKEEDDISFIRNYLTAELVGELKLFTYGYIEDYDRDDDGERYIEIKEKIRDDVVEALVSPLYNSGVPEIVVVGTGTDGSLILRHNSEEVGTLNFKFAEKTLEYIWDLWTAPIELHAKDDDGEDVKLSFDEAGFFINDGKPEDDEDEEEDWVIR